MTEMQQVMTLFTILISVLVGLQIYHHRQLRQDMRDMERRTDERFSRVDDRFDRVDDRFDRVDERFNRVDERFNRVYERFDRVENDIKILINDVGELKGAVGISTSRREREPAGTAD